MLIGVYKDIHPFNKMSEHRIDAYLDEASKQGVELVFFGIHDVDFTNEKIHGDFFVDNNWIKRYVNFPVLMINDSARRVDNSIDREKETALKQRIPYTVNLIEGKYKIYERLLETDYSAYIIPSNKLVNVQVFMSMINKYSKVVLKPVDGCQGKGIFVVSKDKKNIFIVQEHKTIIKLTFTKMLEFINRLVKQGNYLVQSLVHCRTKEGEPYDFRVRVMRNHQAQWIIMLIVARIGDKRTHLSNASLGGRVEPDVAEFLEVNFGVNGQSMYKRLRNIADGLANQIDSFYPYMLDELGIDLSIDANGSIWFYEANTSPQVLKKQSEIERAVHTIGYAKYLYNVILMNRNKNDSIKR